MQTVIIATIVGASTGGSLLLVSALSADTSIPLGQAASFGIFACGVVLWIGRKFQRLEDAINNLPCNRCECNQPNPKSPDE